MAFFNFRFLIWVLLFCGSCYIASGKTVKFLDHHIKLEIGKTKTLVLVLNEPLNKAAKIRFTYDMGTKGPSDAKEDHLVKELPDVDVPAYHSGVSFDVTALRAGHLILGVKSSSKELENLKSAFIRIEIVHSSALCMVNVVVGWIYFAVWSVSLYPQVYENWSRKSVVGLNFDYLLYNMFGFAAYSVFNVGLFWVPSIQDSYMKIHPRGINPVQMNDVVFTLHAVFVTALTVIQCYIYERGDQKLSKYHSGLVTLTGLFLLVSLVLAVCDVITWLTYLYYFSYVKLVVTFIKYVPQAYMNYKRKSTEGWSIGTVMLDFTGSSFCIVQMFLLAHNSDDWGSITGNITKMSIAVFTLLFDCVFMTQHFCLYRHIRCVDQETELLQVTTLK